MSAGFRSGWVAATAVALAALVWAAPAAASADAPFGHVCAAENGVRFCPTTDLASRVPSFDGVPLDVDVTLPAQGKGPFPTIVMLHGFGGSKTDFETTSPLGPAPEEAGNGSTIYRYNNVFYAQRGYAVVNYTARGFGNSCGGGTGGDHVGPCATGYIRPGKRPTRPNRPPTPRQQLPLRQEPQSRAPTPRPRRPLLPTQQLPLHRQHLPCTGDPADPPTPIPLSISPLKSRTNTPVF